MKTRAANLETPVTKEPPNITNRANWMMYLTFQLRIQYTSNLLELFGKSTYEKETFIFQA